MQNSLLTFEDACMVLGSLPGVGPATIHKLLNYFEQDVLSIFQANSETLDNISYLRSQAKSSILNASSLFNIEEQKLKLKKIEGQFITYRDNQYPSLLRQISDYPIGLYGMGSFYPKENTIAIVGSRNTTFYGLAMAKKIASGLASRGFCIVSGLARGIDTAAHQGALEVGGKTVAVLGCGLDVIYPPENEALYKKIQQSGAILSEFSLGQRGDKYTFPMRNRIISGMSQAVVVIETDLHGGSMITARLAGEQGRHVFAVPGRVDQATSAGCHALIRDGATLIRDVDDILEEIHYLSQLSLPLEKPLKVLPELSELEQNVYDLLKKEGYLSADAISQHTDYSIAMIHSTLLMLEIKKLVVKRMDGLFEMV